MATNWDEAGREETSPENDYTNNEVRPTTHTRHLLAHYHLTVSPCLDLAMVATHHAGAHGPPSIPEHLALSTFLYTRPTWPSISRITL